VDSLDNIAAIDSLGDITAIDLLTKVRQENFEAFTKQWVNGRYIVMD
jgi:hypothetical protein